MVRVAIETEPAVTHSDLPWVSPSLAQGNPDVTLSRLKQEIVTQEAGNDIPGSLSLSVCGCLWVCVCVCVFLSKEIVE